MTLAPTAEELATVDEAAASAPPPRSSPQHPPSLVRRLVTLHFVLSVAVLALVGMALSAMFNQRSTAAFDNQLSENVLNLVAGASVDETGQAAAPALTDERAERVYSGRYWQMYAAPANGPVRSLARSRSLWDAPDLALPAGGGATALATQPGHPVYYDGDGPLKQPLRIVAEEVRLAGAADPVVFLEAQDRSPLDADIRAFATTTALALLVLAGMLIAGVMLQVRVGLTPLFALQRQVAGVRTGKSERVVGDWPAELEPLASELNALVAHNQDVVERQRTHVGNLAHALKTPLSVMAAEADARPGALAEVVKRQAALMRQQVDHHLRRARAAARQQSGERTEVAAVLEELSLTLERIFRDKGVEVDWRAPDDLYFRGERQDFMELAGNLMENACKWCRARVRVDAVALSEGDLRLTVEDDGAGLAAADRAEVLRRGARLDETAPGSGLGLSIVDELARAYGGALALDDTPMGGLKVSLTLPRAET